MASKKSEVNLLIKIIRTIYEAYGDRGTWKRRSKNHHLITFKYKAEMFRTAISTTPRNIGTQFDTVRRELNRIGLDKGNNRFWEQLHVRMATPLDDYLDMEGYLGALEEVIRVSKSSDYKGSPAQRAYFRDVKRITKERIPHKKKKPYRKRLEFEHSTGRWKGEVKFWRHYVWAVRYRRDDTRVEGFHCVDKLTYQSELRTWKEVEARQK